MNALLQHVHPRGRSPVHVVGIHPRGLSYVHVSEVLSTWAGPSTWAGSCCSCFGHVALDPPTHTRGKHKCARWQTLLPPTSKALYLPSPHSPTCVHVPPRAIVFRIAFLPCLKCTHRPRVRILLCFDHCAVFSPVYLEVDRNLHMTLALTAMHLNLTLPRICTLQGATTLRTWGI
jgi:hypothetical protein